MTTSDAVGQQSAREEVTSALPARMADPAAWAVTAFATTSFMLGMFQTGLLNNAGVLRFPAPRAVQPQAVQRPW
jgi:succinate-acetate transporter protein